MKFLNFFLLLWVIFVLLDPDPDSESETLLNWNKTARVGQTWLNTYFVKRVTIID